MTSKPALLFGSHASVLPVVHLDEGDTIADLSDYVTVPTNTSTHEVAAVVVVVDDAGTTGQVAANVDGTWYEVAGLFAP